MNFEQAMAEYARLRQGYDSRQISGEEFGRRVQALQVQDASGTYWAIDGNSGGWLRYDGSNWVPGTPPIPQAPGAGQFGGYNAAATQVAPGNFGGPQPQQGGFGQQQGGFGQPQQGGFGAPAQGGYGGQPVGMAAAQPAKARSNRTPLLIGCGVLLLLLICGGGGAAYAISQGIFDSTTGLTEAATAKTITSDKRPDQKTNDFTASTQMYITYTAKRAKKGETVDLKLYRDGTKVDLTGNQTTFEKDATYYGYYTYTPSVKGSYKAELYYNGESTPSQTLNFTVK